MINVTIFNENYHEQIYDSIKKIYPNGIHGCIKQFLEEDKNLSIKTCTFDDFEHGLTEEILSETDVLIFWSHAKQDEFLDKVSLRIKKYVLQGMGFLVLHSGHFSKPIKELLGTSMTLKWKHGESEKLWCIMPSHPIAKNVPECINLPQEEMYGEFFDIPTPEELIFLGHFSNGYVFRSGCVWTRGLGKIFYFQPGHEEYPIYYDKNIQKIIKNAVYYLNNSEKSKKYLECFEVK